jgi:hypothetical protein
VSKERREQIQKEYGDIIGGVGQKIFQLAVPYLEIGESLMQALRLARENRKLMDAEKQAPDNLGGPSGKSDKLE